MNRWLFGLIATLLLLGTRVARADAHSNCINACLLTQVQCSRSAGMTGVDRCNQASASCQARCPPPTQAPPPPAASPSTGGSAQPRVIIPEFPGNGAPLPAPVDTASQDDAATAAETERLRLAANFEAIQTHQYLVKSREELVALNRWLEAAAATTGQNVHYADPAPIPPPRLVPPPKPRARGNGSAAAAPPTELPKMPPEFFTSAAPSECPKVAAARSGPRLIAQCPGLADINASMSQGISVLPNCEDDTVDITVSTKKRVSVRFDLRFVALEGDAHESQASIGNVRANVTTRTNGGGVYTPFPAPPTGPRHVSTIQALRVEAVDIDDAYKRWLASNPQCDPSRTPGATCYFDAWQYRVSCGPTTPTPVR